MTDKTEQTKSIIVRRLNGTVVSDRMQKTVVVAVDQIRIHPRYKKRYRVTKRYKAHDEENNFHVGDAVTIEATRPKSKEKRWTVISGPVVKDKKEEIIEDSNE